MDNHLDSQPPNHLGNHLDSRHFNRVVDRQSNQQRSQLKILPKFPPLSRQDNLLCSLLPNLHRCRRYVRLGNLRYSPLLSHRRVRQGSLHDGQLLNLRDNLRDNLLASQQDNRQGSRHHSQVGNQQVNQQDDLVDNRLRSQQEYLLDNPLEDRPDNLLHSLRK